MQLETALAIKTEEMQQSRKHTKLTNAKRITYWRGLIEAPCYNLQCTIVRHVMCVERLEQHLSREVRRL